MKPAAAMLPRPAKISRKPNREARSERTLQLGAGFEADAFARPDLDGLAGARIAAHARRPLADMERAEAGNAELLRLFKLFRDHARHRIDSLVGHRAR